MQDQTAVKLLYEQSDGAPIATVDKVPKAVFFEKNHRHRNVNKGHSFQGGNSAATWSAAPAARRSSAGVCIAVLAAILMFALGIILGGFLHAVAFPNANSPLALGNWSLESSAEVAIFDNSTNSQPEAVKHTHNPSESSHDETEVELTTDAIYEDEGPDDADCRDFPYKNFRMRLRVTDINPKQAMKLGEKGAHVLPSITRRERQGHANPRLPRDVVPTSYNLTIHPNITTNNMTGSLAIDIQVLNTTKLIVLHADNLIMTTFSMSVNARRMEAEFFFCPASSQWAFMMDEEVHAGDFIDLGIEFQGEVLPDLQGLYISTHTDSRGRKTKSAVTQFEPSYARKMFPCFDEPNFKATFEVSVIREPHHVVRSNMKMKLSEEHVDGLYIDVFHRTVKMSTYLLAVAILDNYDYVKRTTKSTKAPIEVRLYAPKDVIKGQAEFGLDTAIRSLEFFENYFDIPYPLDKIDLLALDDFSEGAMENWGLITFRDSTLLHAEGIASALAKEQIALVICHEIAHQWFGNLVTMNWWNDLWLNEGFANYMEYRCVDKLFPDWNIMTRFYVENVAFSQEPDGLRSSRAVSTHTSNETNIMGLFDAISYHKAAAIIRMLQSLSGERNFQRSLIQYLNKYAYGNAKGSQLWKIVEKHAVLPHGVSIASLATAYITQVGCPMIYVTLSNNEIIIHNQTRHFFEDGMDDDTEWPIPVHYRTDSQREPKLHWMNVDHNKVAWPLVEHSKWVIANTGGFSYVKVLYDKKNYAALARQLRTNHRVISSIDRSMILNDAFDFAKTSKLDIGVYLDLLLYAEEEMDRLPWTLISKQVQYIEDLIEDTSFGHIFKDLQRTLILRPYDRVSWDTEAATTPAEKGLQVEILEMACRLRHRDCIKQAHNRYNDWITKKKRPSPELLGVVLDEGVRQGGVAAWERAYSAYLEAKSPSEKYQLIGAMASTIHPSLISRLLRLCIEGSSFRPNVIPRMLSDLTKNEAARALTWRFFRVNYKEFVRILGDGSNLLINSLRAMLDKFSTQEDLDDVKAFLGDKRLEDNKARLNQLFEQIELNIQWRRLNERPLRKWLENWDEERRVIQRRRRHHKHRHH